MDRGDERLLRELSQGLQACGTEADIVQVLYSYLQPAFGYDIINMHVLEHEGWYHSVAVERGVLQDLVRRELAKSRFADLYQAAQTAIINVGPESAYATGPVHSRGPGGRRVPQVVIWALLRHQGSVIGSVAYQLYEHRSVSPDEVALLEQIHTHLGVLVHNAYLNALTRNQAIGLSALNTIGRALSSTHDEGEVASALHSALSQMLALTELEMVILDERLPGKVRVLRVRAGQEPEAARISLNSRRLTGLRRTLRNGRPALEEDGSVACAPLIEGGRARGALIMHSGQANAYEGSTLTFLEQVAHEVVLALRNAWSYAALEAQRRRLEVVNTIGRRLASSLDLWSILRTLREELARHLDFDTFSLATVGETPEGPVATGYVYDSGQEQVLPPVPLKQAGPSRQAYETGRPVLIRRSPWASSMEQGREPSQQQVQGDRALLVVTRPRARRRVAARSMIWVPARSGDRITALLTLQSYTPDVFGEWHVQLLEDVAAHVGLALANADHFSAAQVERRRLEALHELDMGVAGAANERQIAEAFFAAARSFLGQGVGVLLGDLDSGDRLSGWRAWGREPARPMGPRPSAERQLLRGILEEEKTVTLRLDAADVVRLWRGPEPGAPLYLVATPIRHGGRATGLLVVGRGAEGTFSEHDVRFLENAAPVLAIALRTVRLHQANEMALAQSVRLQEVAGLAGHDLESVAGRVAEQARAMLQAAGVACWAFDLESRVIASGRTGEPSVQRVLTWSGRTSDRAWPEPPPKPLWSRRPRGAWTLIPLWYADRLVGAIGAVRPAHALEELGTAAVEFARHAAIAIESARLADEARGRIRALEAIAAFSELDLAQPELAKVEMGRLIAGALSHLGGALWLYEGDDLIGVSAPDDPRVRVGEPARLLTALRGGRGGRLFQRALRQAGMPCRGEAQVVPVPLGDRTAGLLSAELTEARGEARRLMTVLAKQVGVVLARIELVAELERDARTMNAVLSHSPLGVVLQGGDGRVAFANKAVERLYGTPVQALVGQTLDELYQRGGATAAQRPDAGPQAPLELRLRDRVIEVRQVRIPGSGDEPERILSLHEDVTQERSVQEAKDFMLRAIGHEVRSPAAAMRATIASLLQWYEVMDPVQRRALLDSAYDQSQRLLALVEGQLIISQLETGSFRPNPETVPLERSVEETLALLRHRYGDRTEAIQIDLPAGLPPARCEATHLGQVLVNLLSNALEYSHGPIRLGARLRGRWLELTVRDSGHGVPLDRVETLFTKLVPAGQKRARGGLGLGLYLCRLVVERSFGGRIWLHRSSPEGATFKFTVSAVGQRPSQAAEAMLASGQPLTPQLP